MMPVKHLVLRTAAGLVGTLLAFAATAATASAATGPDLAAASTAAHSTEATQLLSKAAQRPGSAAAKSTAKLAIQQDTIPVYALSADFVSTGAGDVGTLWYVATPATKGTDKLTVFTAPDQAGAWHPVNVATGNTEATMAAAARGAKLLIEPQIGACRHGSEGHPRRLAHPRRRHRSSTRPRLRHPHHPPQAHHLKPNSPKAQLAGVRGPLPSDTSELLAVSGLWFPRTWLVALTTS